jgi:hypothetical protein
MKKLRKLNVRIEEDLLDQIRAAAEDMSISASAYLRIAAIEKLEGEEIARPNPPRKRGR